MRKLHRTGATRGLPRTPSRRALVVSEAICSRPLAAVRLEQPLSHLQLGLDSIGLGLLVPQFLHQLSEM